MNRRIAFLKNNRTYKSGKILSPTGIVVHSTGTNQKRISAYTVQWDSPSTGVCVHGMLGLDDTGELCFTQTLPYNFRCGGCGSGPRGSYNNSHIQFEICEDNLSSAEWAHKTYAAALMICEELCRRFQIPPENVVCHSEAHALGYASNHADVMHWWPKFNLSMDGFRAALRERLEDDMAVRYKSINEVPAALRKETQQLIDAGVLSGKGGAAGLDVTEDMLRVMIVNKRYADKVAADGR